MSKNITIVINTMNKPRMLYAMLNYHAKVKIQCPIIVVDASDFDIFEINSNTIMELKNSLAVVHVVPEDRTTFASISFGANLVATKYVILSGDDDFFMHEALNESASFLEENTDFSGCTGLTFKLDCEWEASINNWKIVSGGDNTPDSFMEEKPSGRIARYSQRIAVPTYAVQRLETVRNSFSAIVSTGIVIDNSLPELLFNVNMLIEGKLRVLPRLYHFWFSAINKRPKGSSLHTGLNSLHWIDKLKSERFINCLNIYLEHTAVNLLRREAMAIEEARDVVLSVWAGYYAPMMLRRTRETFHRFNPTIFRVTNRAQSFKNRLAFIFQHLSAIKIYKLLRTGLRPQLIVFPWHRDYGTYTQIMELLRSSMCRNIGLPAEDPRRL